MSTDKRQGVRKRTFLKGRIHFNNGASSMDCLIRDMSEIGAKLELSETATLPEVFELYILNKDAKYRSTLRWRRGNAVGITFDDASAKPGSEPARPASEAAATDPALSTLLRRISELEAENAALRSVLATMSRSNAA